MSTNPDIKFIYQLEALMLSCFNIEDGYRVPLTKIGTTFKKSIDNYILTSREQEEATELFNKEIPDLEQYKTSYQDGLILYIFPWISRQQNIAITFGMFHRL